MVVRSGLISLIATGLAQRRYAFPNLSPSSATTVVSAKTGHPELHGLIYTDRKRKGELHKICRGDL